MAAGCVIEEDQSREPCLVLRGNRAHFRDVPRRVVKLGKILGLHQDGYLIRERHLQRLLRGSGALDPRAQFLSRVLLLETCYEEWRLSLGTAKLLVNDP